MKSASTHARNIVIIGMGQAAAWAAHTLRAEGYSERIVMLGSEGELPYERPPLSKAVLVGQVRPESTRIFTDDAFAALQIDARCDDPAVELAPGNSAVITRSGMRIPYDRAILCTGGRPRLPDAFGIPARSVHVLRTLQESRRLGAALVPGKHLIVIGGGWIGLEVAAAARSKEMEVTVVESEPRLCQRSVPAALSELLLQRHRDAGVRFRLGVRVDRFDENGEEAGLLRLTNGEVLEADVVLLGVGMVANDELAARAGLKVAGGIVVDHGCRTTDPAILAAGDVAVAPNSWAQRALRLESWQNAQDQAIAAARAALGLNVRYNPLPWFWSDQFDLKIRIAGVPGPHLQELTRPLNRPGSLLRFYLHEGQPTAAIGVNALQEMRAARQIIEQQLPVTEAELTDSGLDLVKLTRRRTAEPKKDTCA